MKYIFNVWCVLTVATILTTAATNDIGSKEISKKWPSLVEIKQKWDDVPLDKVKQAAETNDPTAQHYLGYCFASGERLPKNGDESVVWYERALRGGYLPSANNLGLLYMKGEVVPKDLNKAVYYTRIAAESGLGQALVNLAIFYRDGTGVPQDYKEAMQWFQRAAAQGNTMAMVEIGRAYRFGNGVPKNTQEAMKWFRMASEQGDSLGTVNLGWIYGYETDGSQDEEQAFKLYLQAAENGQKDAMYELYLSYRNGKGVSEDDGEAVKWLTEAAEAGNPLAQCELGYNYECMDWNRYHEIARSNDMPVAIQWYRRSAEQNWPGGEYHLGLCYLAGKGVDWDEEKGLELIRKAADQNQAYSLFKLAGLYAEGIGEPRSENDRPLNLLVRAAKMGLGKAYGEVSDRYQNGLGTERDVVKAAEYYCRASAAEVSGYFVTEKMINANEHDDPFTIARSLYLKSTTKQDAQAAMQIGEMYVAGRNVPQNPVEAWAWFALAKEEGQPDGQNKLSQIEAKMTPQQIASAQNRFRELKKTGVK